MSFDFPAILTIVVVFTGVVSFVDLLYRKFCPTANKSTKPVFIDYCRSFFPVLLIVFVIRSFIVQPYRVPSGSLEPTVVPGDLILVSQFSYGLHLPVWYTRIMPVGEPKRGQIALFYWPVNKKVTFVKRVIGLPGDRISYVNKVLFINGKEATQTLVGTSTDTGNSGESWKVNVYEENLNGIKHKIYVCPASSTNCPGSETKNFYNLIVPEGNYLMMGDNRDNSDDSRDWGFVPENDFIGRALFIFMSWNSDGDVAHKIRWSRIGTGL